jgi:hypothetical protein
MPQTTDIDSSVEKTNWITSTLKKSNPAAEPHGSPQRCTVKPRKGAGQGSRGEFSVSHFLVCSQHTYRPEYCLLMRRHDMPRRYLLHLLRSLPLLPPHLHLRSSHHTKTKCAFYNLVDMCLRDLIYPNYQRRNMRTSEFHKSWGYFNWRRFQCGA